MNLKYYLKKTIDENSIDGLIREKGLYEDLENTLFEDFLLWLIMKSTDY